MIFVSRRLKIHYLFFVVALIFGVFSTPALAANDAQGWVDKGLTVSETKPNSDEEAICYRRALEIDDNHASALFNLAYVLDSQVSQDWAKRAPVWADLEKLYEAFEHYTAAVIVKPQDSQDACTNTLRLAKLLLDPPINRPPDINYLYGRILMVLEVLENQAGFIGVKKELNHLKSDIESRLSALKDAIPEKELVRADKIEDRLTLSFKRGKSPYKGPRIPLMIQFDYNCAEISNRSSSQLREMAEALKRDSLVNMKILIEGHSDSDGSLEYNKELSKQRAMSVKQYLQENFNLASNRFEIRGYGETRPLVSNNTNENKAMNRRVEFVNMQKLKGFTKQISNIKRSGRGDAFDMLY